MVVPRFMRNSTPLWLRRLRSFFSLNPGREFKPTRDTLFESCWTLTLVTPTWCGCERKHHGVSLAIACLRNTSAGEVPLRWAIASNSRWPSLGKILLTGLCWRICNGCNTLFKGFRNLYKHNHLNIFFSDADSSGEKWIPNPATLLWTFLWI